MDIHRLETKRRVQNQWKDW